MSGHIEAFYRLWFDVNRVYEVWARRQGLTLGTLFLLDELSRGASRTQKELCGALFLPKQTVSGMVKVLEAKGYVGVSGDGSDGRKKLVLLTPAGAEFAGGILREMQKNETRAFGKLGGDADTLVKLWRDFGGNLKESFEVED